MFVYRFGNHIIINQYGMRTSPFTEKKIDNDYRVMVFGDSVLNGGSLTDHSSLSTSIVQDNLSELDQGHVIVGNISAGSWGPGNWLAYAKEYGFFEADVIVLVISSHDYVDNPNFKPLNENTHPTKSPISALLEGIERYLPRYLPQTDADSKKATDPDKFAAADGREAEKGLNDLRLFLEAAQANSSTVLVLQHWEKSEIENGRASPGYQRIKEVCELFGINPISLEPYFRRSIESGESPFRDNIHPNEVGQRLIAEAILENMPN